MKRIFECERNPSVSFTALTTFALCMLIATKVVVGQTVTYPYPAIIYPYSPTVSTTVTQTVTQYGCPNPANDGTTVSSFPSAYYITAPFAFGAFPPTGGNPPDLSVQLPSSMTNFLTLVNGVSQGQGTVTAAGTFGTYPAVIGSGIGYKESYSLSISGNTASEQFKVQELQAAQNGNGILNANNVYNVLSSYNIQTGIQTFTVDFALSNVQVSTPQYCSSTTSVSQVGTGIAFYYSPFSGTLNVEYGTDAAEMTWLGLVIAQDANGQPLAVHAAANQLGFDHFNWLQIITSDLQLQGCATDNSFVGCSALFTITGAVPPLPTNDPPDGGYRYNLCPASNSESDHCQSSFPAQDFWPMYWDEYFSPVPGSDYYTPNPSAPEYLQKYRFGNTLLTMGDTNQSPATALGFSFSDMPDTIDVVVPGAANTPERISFVDALVGVAGSCNVLASSTCGFQIIPGTTFRWAATNGTVSAINPPSSSASLATRGRNVQKLKAKHPNDFPVNPIDLTGQQLATSLISVNQFLALAKLTPQALASMGGGIASFSASLIPSQSAALAAVQAGGTLVPSSQVATTASGLAYSRVTQTFNGTVTIKNIGSSAITGPLQICLLGLPPDVTLVNAAGRFSEAPYLTISTASLPPGKSVNVSVQFKNPSNAIIALTPIIYSGSLN